MKRVDPSIKLAGPAESNPTTAGGGLPWVDTSCVTTNGLTSACTNGDPGWTNDAEYIPELLAAGNPRPAVITFHGYGGGDTPEENTWYTGTNGDGGSNVGVANYKKADMAAIAAANVPVWIDEANVSAGYSGNPVTGTDQRSMTQMGAAWLADYLIAWSFDPHIEKMFQFAAQGQDASWDLWGLGDLSGKSSCVPQTACRNERASQPDLEYWSMYWLNHWLTPGKLVSVANVPNGVAAMAVQTAPHNVVVLLVNVAPGKDNGNGAPATVKLRLSGSTVTDVRRIAINGSTNWSNGPSVTDLGAHSDLTIKSAGYELDLLKFTT